jgi:hypothetical protein
MIGSASQSHQGKGCILHRRSPSLLARVVFPDPGWPVMMMHFGFLLMLLDA